MISEIRTKMDDFKNLINISKYGEVKKYGEANEYRWRIKWTNIPQHTIIIVNDVIHHMDTIDYEVAIDDDTLTVIKANERDVILYIKTDKIKSFDII